MAKIETTPVGMIPLPAETLTPKVAAEWLRDWAGYYVRVIEYGFQSAKTKADRESYAMLAVDVARLVEICGEVLASGEPVTLEVEKDIDHPRTVCAHLARICATRPDGVAEGAYVALARRIEALMGEEFAEGALEPRPPLRVLRGCA